jgi:hypothetical protein
MTPIALRGPRRVPSQPHARTRSGGHAALIQDSTSANSRSQSDLSRELAEGPTKRAQGKHRRTHRRAVSIVLAVFAALLAIAPTAGATYDPIAGGQTKLTLAKPFLALLKENGVVLSASGGAAVKAGVATFPLTAGKLDPVSVRGLLEHEGTLTFARGRHKLPMKALQLKTTQASSPLSAKFGGGKLKLASSSKLTTARSGFGLRAQVGAIRLSAKLATRLDKKLGLRGVFGEGQLLGSSTTTAQPATVTIEEAGRAELLLAPDFAAKLASLFVAVNPIFPAEHLGAPFTLPIVGGQIAPDAGAGTLETAGSLELIQQDGGQAFIRELAPELGLGSTRAEYQFIPSPTAPGPLSSGPLLGLGAGTVVSEPDARTIALAGAPLALPASTAQALNETFAKPQGKSNVFQAGEALGAITFTAQAQ